MAQPERAAKRVLAGLLAGLLLAAGAPPAMAEPFPEPPALARAVDFWTRVYVEVNTREGFIHDTEHLNVVYETVRFRADSSAHRQRLVDERKRHWQAVLGRLAAGRAPADAAERRVVEAFEAALGRRPEAGDFSAATSRLRFQLGQSDKFRAGLVRAGRYEAMIHEVLRRHEVPADIVYLPHVESSFNTHARSKYGAGGMWQFMPATGRRYLAIDALVDERLDPELATIAAARLLRDNFAKLGSWPLALIAYNHGAGGMARAVRNLGTKDVVRITHRYRSRTFGFASRNFYPQFLAARRVARDPERYFGPIERERPVPARVVTLPFYLDARDLERHLGISRETLAEHNPALRPVLLSGERRLPKGYRLRLPATLSADASGLIARLPPEARHAEQVPVLTHTVRRGDTLAAIARRHGTTVARLAALNKLANPNRIRPGQVLEVATRPARAQQTPSPAARAAAAAPALSTPPVPRVRPTEVALAPEPRAKPDSSALASSEPLPRSKPARTALAPEPRAKPGSLALASGDPLPRSKPVAAARVPEPPVKPESVALAPDEPLPRAKPEPRVLAANEPAPRATPETHALAAMPSSAGIEPVPAVTPAAASGPGEWTLASASSVDVDLADAAGGLAIDPGEPWLRVDGEWIVAAPGETLGHYADWLGLRTQRLRDRNGFARGRTLRIGERLRLDFSRVPAAEFVARRLAFHEALRQAFFADWRVTGTVDHTLRPGENLWVLAQEIYAVPAWLIRRYNPSTDPERLTPGMGLRIPVLERRSS